MEVKINQVVHAPDAGGLAVKTAFLHNGNGGATVALEGRVYSGGDRGYAVSVDPWRTVKVEGPIIAPADVQRFLDDNTNAFRHDDEGLAHCVGTWFNPVDGLTYIDVTLVVDSLCRALRFAKAHNQIAIYDLQRGVVIETGGTGG